MPQGAKDRLGARGRIALVGFSLAAAYFLWTEHRPHAIRFLPWAILALCPLLHLFMHRGHASHAADDARGRGGRER